MKLITDAAAFVVGFILGFIPFFVVIHLLKKEDEKLSEIRKLPENL